MNIKLIVEYIKSDLYRYSGSCSLKSFFKQIVRNRSFKYLFWFRLTNSHSFLVKYLAYFFHDRLSKKYGIIIPKGTQIGYGLYIGHHMCVVVHPTTKIGNNCNLSQFTTIGSNENKAAEIGDNVYIGPNVCIVENVKIGNNSIIGAGAVVVKNIPENATAAGVPAIVISYKNPGRYIKNHWVTKNEEKK